MFKLLYTKYPYVSDPLHQADELLHLLIAFTSGALPTADSRMYLQYHWFGEVTIDRLSDVLIFSPDTVNGDVLWVKSFTYFVHYVATAKLLHW